MNNKSRKMHGLLYQTKSGEEEEEEGKRIRRNTYYPSIFTQHAVQPKTTNNATSTTCPTNTVISAPIFMEEQRLQPMSESSNSSNNSTDNDSDKFPGKKRSRSTNPTTTTTTTTTTDELRIEATSSSNNDYDMNIIIDEIEAATTNSNNHKYSSLYLKGVRVSSFQGSSGSRLCEEKNNKNDILLLQALKDLVKHQAGSSSWRTIKVHNCSPSIVEAVLLSSPSSVVNFEEIHLVNMHDDDEEEEEETNNDDSLILLQPILSSNRASMKHVDQATTSTLIMNLLNKTVRLKRLVLKNCNLRDSNLFQIMNILCRNHSKTLESLDIRYNMFTSISIRSVLAIHLRSSLHSLKSISLRQGIRCVVNPKVRDAILQGLQHNQVILESIDIFDYDRYIQHFLDINRSGRRKVLCNENFPRSLWPILLERTTIEIPPGRRRIAVRQVNVVYHMFRNGGPLLLQQQQ